MHLTALALRRPVTTLAATCALVVLGAVSLGRLPVALLPDFALPVLTIRASYPDAVAPEVERAVVEPLETAIVATPGLVELRSSARDGEASIVARFTWGTDMATTVLAVRERLDATRAALPEAASRPTLLTAEPGQRPIVTVALTGDGDLRTLKRLAQFVFKRRLEQLDGVALASVIGGPEPEVRVDLDAGRLRALGLSTDDIARAIKDNNVGAPGGTIRRGQFRFAVRALTELRSPEEIADIPVPLPASSVRLGEIATVEASVAEPLTVVRLDGRPAVGLVVYKDAGANTVRVTREIHRVLRDLESDVQVVRATVIVAQAGFVSDALGNLMQEIVLGTVFAFGVLVLFLRDWRAALAIGVVIPLSVLAALVTMQALGVTLNVFSLGGLALGVGMLVDNAIVVSEAAARRRELGAAGREAVLGASAEVGGPLVAAALTTVLVFGPIVFVRGLAAALFRDLSISVAAALGASVVLALAVLPVLIRGTSKPPRTQHAGRRASWGRRVVAQYETWLERCLTRPGRVIAATGVVLIVVALVAAALPREILPAVSEWVLAASVTLPEGTALEATAAQVARIEATAARAGAVSVYARIGRATDEEVLAGVGLGGANAAELLLRAPPGRSADELAAELRRELPDLARGGVLAFDASGQSEFRALAGRGGRTIVVDVAAADRAQADVAASAVRARLDTVPGLADVRLQGAGTRPAVEIELRRARIAERGVAPEAVAAALAGGLRGIPASELRETERRTPIMVRLAGAAHQNLEAALATSVGGVPVGQLVQVTETQAPAELVRIDQRPVVPVEALVTSGGTARAAGRIARALESAPAPLPQGVTWRLSGADVERRRATGELLLVAVLAAALVFLVLAAEFESFTTPLLVMLTVPLAAGGGILALAVTGQSLNVVSLIGLVVVIGIADNDAVVKLATIRRYRAEGFGLNDAIHRAGRERLRPIAMIDCTSLAGVLPLAVGLGAGGELYRPLAVAVIGGLVTATLVTLFLLPTVYAAVERHGGGASA